MISRDEFLLKIRPVISNAKITSLMSKEEIFQNRTIRPIALLQNDILVEVFKHYIKKHKNVFYDLSVEKRIDYI